MKVTTDACLFGAVLADAFRNTTLNSALDIGTGTGLLTLMLAQQQPARIDAVEIVEAAAQQAGENFNASPWADRLKIFQRDIADFHSAGQYPLIFSNPPFFEHDLRSHDEHINAARHDTGLKLDALFHWVRQHLTDNGHWVVLLPTHRIEDALREAVLYGLQLYRRINIRQTPAHSHFRGILFFSPEGKSYLQEEIVIRDADNNYSKKFSGLLEDYYLYL